MWNIVKHCETLQNIVKHWIVTQNEPSSKRLAVCWTVAWYVCKSSGTSTKTSKKRRDLCTRQYNNIVIKKVVFQIVFPICCSNWLRQEAFSRYDNNGDGSINTKVKTYNNDIYAFFVSWISSPKVSTCSLITQDHFK